ncbi:MULTISPECIES: response regulator [Halomonadaceae]|uniref:Response regulator n=1 Tax=Vreelandella halophila TaxID=86177 RepID=A0A9X4YD09_9GAMM|nr:MULTISPECIES: response regulator [Halomonas]MYL27003.1 response regulator [Halomonas utahensis]MYL75805.1 response regulator [Halomonas sp. 22501_18_FS]
MSTGVIICDDSSMARKQMARALPADWDTTLTFVEDGDACLEAIRDGKGSVVFLDLNMPGSDGYVVLEHVHREELPALVLVVSGDIQPEAYRRVLRLGALNFIRKPIDPQVLAQTLKDYGLYSPSGHGTENVTAPPTPGSDPDVPWQDALQEIANIAMGQAGDLLARLLDVFIKLPVPRVNMLAASELRMALNITDSTSTWSGVCQGFSGAGITGEGLLLFNNARLETLSHLLGYPEEDNASNNTEPLMDLSSIMVGAFLRGFGQQMDRQFGLSHPVVLGTHLDISDLLDGSQYAWQQILTIELTYTIESHDLECDLLLLFSEESVAPLREALAWLPDPSTGGSA